MTVIRISTAIAVLLIIGTSYLANSQAAIPSDLASMIQGFQSTDRETRAHAFKSLTEALPPPKGDYHVRRDLAFSDSLSQLEPNKSGAIKKALIDLLQREQALKVSQRAAERVQTLAEAEGPDKPEDSSEENEDDYYESLLFDVASLVDERALPLLVKELSTGNIVARGVARFGSIAVQPVISEADDAKSDTMNRLACPSALSLMLQTRSVTLEDNPSEHQLIKRAALRWTTASDFGLRVSNAYLLAQINDADTIRALQTMATDDPQVAVDVNGETRHYGREAAQNELKLLGTKLGKGFFVRPM